MPLLLPGLRLGASAANHSDVISNVLPLFNVSLERIPPSGVLHFSFQGAKNHGVVMPDANKENTINQLVGAAFGAAGQRCMALSTAIFVGESQQWLPELVERSKSLRVNAGNLVSDGIDPQTLFHISDVFVRLCVSINILGNGCKVNATLAFPQGDQPGADVGPLISPEAKARVESLIQSGVEEGAKLLLDGRNVNVKGYENGNFVGPTILGNVTVRAESEQT